MRGAAGAFNETVDAAEFLFQILRGQSIETCRAHIAATAGADGVGAVVENDGDAAAIGGTEIHDGELGIERAGGLDFQSGFARRIEPGNAAVVEEQPAVGTDGAFLAELVVEGSGGESGVGVFDRLHDGALNFGGELWREPEPVRRGGAGGVMGVGGIDEDMRGRDAGGLFNFDEGCIDHGFGDPEDIAGDDGDLARGGLFHDDGDGAEFALLFFRETRFQISGQRHVVVGEEILGGGTDAQVVRGTGGSGGIGGAGGFHIGNEVGHCLRLEASLEAFGHEGDAGALDGFDFLPGNETRGAIDEFKRHAVAGLGGDESIERGAIGQRAEAGIEARLHIGAGIEDVREELFRRVIHDRNQIRPDLIALPVALVAADAACGIHLLPALHIAGEFQRRLKLLDDLLAAAESGEHLRREIFHSLRRMILQLRLLRGIQRHAGT